MRKLINVIQINLIAVFTIMTIIFLFFGNSIYIIQGGSMNPTFFQGDIVFTIKKNPANINAGFHSGDIAVIKGPEYYIAQGSDPLFWVVPNGTIIIHRIVDKKLINNTYYFLTKGDNNKMLDGSIRSILNTENYSLYEYNESNGIYISENAIKSIVILRIPFIGILRNYLPFIIFIMYAFIIMSLIFKKYNLKLAVIKNQHHKSRLFTIFFLFLFLILIFSSTIQILIESRMIYRVNKTSMEPYLNYNDIVLISNNMDSHYSIGDIIVIKSAQYFYENGFDEIFWHGWKSYIIHIILDKKEINKTRYYLTGGLNSFYPYDGMFRTIIKNETYFFFEYNRSKLIYLPETEILGKAIIKIPILGFFSEYFHALITFILICMISGVYFKTRELSFTIKKVQNIASK